MTSPAPLRGPQGGDPAKVREAIVKDAGEAAARQTKAHFTTALTATEKRLIEAITETQARDAFDKGKDAGILIGRAEAKAHRTWHYLAVACVAAGLAVLATMYVYERTTLFGVAIGRGEASHNELRTFTAEPPDDKGVRRGNEPKSAP